MFFCCFSSGSSPLKANSDCLPSPTPGYSSHSRSKTKTGSLPLSNSFLYPCQSPPFLSTFGSPSSYFCHWLMLIRSHTPAIFWIRRWCFELHLSSFSFPPFDYALLEPFCCPSSCSWWRSGSYQSSIALYSYSASSRSYCCCRREWVVSVCSVLPSAFSLCSSIRFWNRSPCCCTPFPIPFACTASLPSNQPDQSYPFQWMIFCGTWLCTFDGTCAPIYLSPLQSTCRRFFRWGIN